MGADAPAEHSPLQPPFDRGPSTAQDYGLRPVGLREGRCLIRMMSETIPVTAKFAEVVLIRTRDSTHCRSAASAQPGINWILIGTGNDPSTGDIYWGLDRRTGSHAKATLPFQNTFLKRSVEYDCSVFVGTPSTLRGWKPRLATRSRRLSDIAARHRACLGGSFVWFGNVPGTQIRYHLDEPGWKAACWEWCRDLVAKFGFHLDEPGWKADNTQSPMHDRIPADNAGRSNPAS